MAEHSQPLGGGNTGHLRQRPLGRAATFADAASSPYRLRRNSTLSDTVSDAKQSIRSSTDDLLFPRARHGRSAELHEEESHWNSAPLALALLPAIGGVFFKNGSAVITDLILLVLAAIFLNWSVRLPWDWYRSAQAVRRQDSANVGIGDAIEEPENLDSPEEVSKSEEESHSHTRPAKRRGPSPVAVAATKELYIHELVALGSCFIFPLIGTWLLHAIRSKLSRPSEGLVSNYNLTIFLLASEIRPFAHLLKMVQARTLHLQRVVASSPSDDSRIDVNKLLDLAKRLDELEAHVADTTAALVSSTPLGESQSPSSANEREHAQNVAAQAASEVQKTLQPELDALNRAVRRYEKRTTVMAFQIESRLQELETQVGDAITLAAANGHSGFFLTLVAWVRTIIALVVQGILGLASFPIFITSYVLQTLKSFLGIQKWSSQRDRKGKQPRNTSSPSPRRQRRGHSTISAQGLRGAKKVI